MVIKNSIVYLSSSLINKSVPFLLLPIITAYLSPEEYGKLAIFMIFISVYNALVGMSLQTNISKNYFKVTKEELAQYIGNIFILLITSMVIYLIISMVLYLLWESFFSIPTWLFLMIPFLAAFNMVNTLNLTILRNEQRAYMFGIFEVSNTVIKMGTTVLLLIVVGLGWYSQVFGVLAGAVIFSIIGVLYMLQREYIHFSFDKKKIKSIIYISLPLIPHVLAAAVISMSDRLFIEQMVSLQAVGVYAVGYSFGMVVMLFSDAFIKAWSPWFYKSLAEPTDSKKVKIVKYTYVYIIGMFLLAIGISMVAEFILPYMVNEKFYDARQYIFWIALGYAVRGIYQIFFPYLVHINRTSFLAISTVLAAVVNLVLNYIFIRYYGAIGAAYATLGAFLLSAMFVFWYQQKNYYMPWLMRR